MSDSQPNRRSFIRNSAVGTATACAAVSAIAGMPRVAAEEARLDASKVQFNEHLEPLIRILEDSPRDEVLEKVAAAIHGGRSYQEVLAALLLAGVRNVQPRPSVGFKFHCVLVVNSCHLASLAGPDEDRWLPIFWAIDYFKSSQADEKRRSDWHMKPVNESAIPGPAVCRARFIEAMDRWDVDLADVATAGLVRTAGATEVFNLFARYAARDYRSIGHKAIYLANAWRTLQVIGWQHAEPVLRSLAFALLNHEGDPNPSDSDLDADRPWRSSHATAKSLPTEWTLGSLDDSLPSKLIQEFRHGSPSSAAELAGDGLRSGVSPQSVWDGVFVGAGELLMRQPGIIGLHGLTTANAMHFLWQTSSDDETRRRLLLQACSFNPMFRDSAKSRGKLSDAKIDKLREEVEQDSPVQLDDVLSEISGNRMAAATKVHSFLTAGGDGYQFVSEARRLLFAKGRDAHDYKFCSAVLEDYDHVSDHWRDMFLSLSVFNLKGTHHPDSGLVGRTESALRKVTS